MPPSRATQLLGGLTPERFLAEYWQKKPLYVKGALPGWKGLLKPDELFEMAGFDEAQGRLVTTRAGRYELEPGPFAMANLRRRGKRDWTVLVQGVNHYLRSGEALLGEFSFVPHARLDDLMVSYARPGGSAGPHFDSYDVFLLQGIGHRRWQISSQTDLSLIPGADLRILSSFRADEEWVTGPGDLLYLPPRYAHFGVALDECMTYSVGFRAPTERELRYQFFAFLDDELNRAADCAGGPEAPGAPGAIYADPDLETQRHASAVSDAMVQKVARMFAGIRWDAATVGRFLGRYLSEPKAHIVFDRPARPLGLLAFQRRVEARGVRLALASLMLSRGDTVYLNGEATTPPKRFLPLFVALADARALPKGTRLEGAALEALHGYYLSGYLVFER